MTIETRFNIGDLVQYKFQKNEITKLTPIALEVIEIHCVNCYTTAQVFYTLRPIHVETDYDFKEMKYRVKNFLAGASRNSREEYVKFREDELKPCSEENKNILLAE